MGNKHNLAVFPVFALLLRQVESLALQNHIHGCNEQVQRFKSHWKVPLYPLISRIDVRLFLKEIFKVQNKEYGGVTLYVSVMRVKNCLLWYLHEHYNTTLYVSRNLNEYPIYLITTPGN